MSMIIAAYAGTGKTTLAEMYPDTVFDFVCMPYKYYLSPDRDRGEAGKGNPYNVMREDWPYNYVEAIKSALDAEKTLLIPSDVNVLATLRQEGIPYTLCYPQRDAKEVYRQRFIDRGNTEDFLSIFIDGWDQFIDKLETTETERRIVLQPHQFLRDVFDFGNEAKNLRIELPIINEPETGLCAIANLLGNGQTSKILISTACHNNYISEDLYNRLDHENSKSPLEITKDNTAYYLNDLTDAKAGVIKSLLLPGHTLSDVPVIVTPSFPAYQCDMVLSALITKGKFVVDNEKGFVIMSDEQL